MTFHVNDVVALSAATLVVIFAAPVFASYAGFGGPLTSILGELVIPVLFLGLIISAGVSARGGR